MRQPIATLEVDLIEPQVTCGGAPANECIPDVWGPTELPRATARVRLELGLGGGDSQCVECLGVRGLPIAALQHINAYGQARKLLRQQEPSDPPADDANVT